MLNANIQNQIAAAFAAIVSAAVFVGASIGPAAQNVSSFIA
ncbi:hypothetical protein SAMN02745824_3072 [Parasphingorhabdus marina DSM 22363]|uniref:Uncharacterized protein n=1 Tax=Parasphingorhabdus marina DSM 22363 TaxID=1123272 RepID=A0A1N6GZW6_9SPHN|nr:hypothetical protein [Parasphingorhabdus marina]SIO13121.1 hypothetical protein SAMN02745824_3072 [Parasphingorhabdus marina DSM 22363]